MASPKNLCTFLGIPQPIALSIRLDDVDTVSDAVTCATGGFRRLRERSDGYIAIWRKGRKSVT